MQKTLQSYSGHALALLRVITALLFIEHATMKFFGFPAPIPGMTGPLPPLFLAGGIIELVAGGLILIGLFTRFAAFVASGEMAVAYFMMHASQSFWPGINMGEAAILFCFIFLYLVVSGPGSLSIDEMVGRRKLPESEPERPTAV
ncbi:MAG: DoxX family protein [Sphingomicrobium sp.]